MIIQSTSNYKKFNYLPFNRITDNTHTNSLVNSITRYGNLRAIITVRTDLITGSDKLFIVDGQHLFEALRSINEPIFYIETKVSNMASLIDLIAAVNNTSRKWTLYDYIRAWSEIKASYLYLRESLNTYRLQPTIILTAFSTTVPTIRTGKFNLTPAQKEKGILLLNEVISLKKICNLSAKAAIGLIYFIRSIPSYDSTQMKRNLKLCIQNQEFKFLADSSECKIIWSDIYHI